jgi:hypothetical protein
LVFLKCSSEVVFSSMKIVFSLMKIVFSSMKIPRMLVFLKCSGRYSVFRDIVQNKRVQTVRPRAFTSLVFT